MRNLVWIMSLLLGCAACDEENTRAVDDMGRAGGDAAVSGDVVIGADGRRPDGGRRDVGRPDTSTADGMVGGDMAPTPDAAPPRGRLVLTRGDTTTMVVGTHRPEIRATEDGTLVVAVVHPGSNRDPEGQIKHRVYRMDADLNPIGEPFPITRIVEPNGEPADHRIALVNGEIVVVYQTLNYEGGSRPMNGPSEPFATDQSLMLTRYSMDGQELFRGPIVDRTSDFDSDNFPDHCLLWRGDRLLVSSGSRSRSVHIREVGLDGSIHADHVFQTSRQSISGNIGNSMHSRGDGVGYFSSNSPAGNGALTLTALNADFESARLTELGGDDGVERHFPTDSRVLGDYTLVTYISRPAGQGMRLEDNPYAPRIMVIDADYAVAYDIELGEGGFAHVHPTMTILGDQLLVAWSKRSERNAPQVQIERFTLSWE